LLLAAATTVQTEEFDCSSNGEIATELQQQEWPYSNSKQEQSETASANSSSETKRNVDWIGQLQQQRNKR